jgi:perosamine synthetase
MKVTWSEPTIGKQELNSVVNSFEASWLTMGPKVKKFEELFSSYLDVNHAVAVNNGTTALDLVLKAVGVKENDEVIVPAMTYIATATAVLYQRAVPVFVDIEKETFNLNPEKIEKAISSKTKAILFIDYGGNPAYIDEIVEVGRKKGILVIQDAAQSLGGKYKNCNLGSQTLISTMSFHMAKIMTTVEGGMVLTHDDGLAEKIRIIRNQGEDPKRKYHHIMLGTNGRMTDMQAAIGIEQFKKLENNVRRRQGIAEKYDNYFDEIADIKVMKDHPELNCVNAYFFYPVLIPQRDRVASLLRERGIDTRIAYPMAVYKQDMFVNSENPCKFQECPVTEEFTSKVINLPIFPDMKEEEIDYVATNLIDILRSKRD